MDSERLHVISAFVRRHPAWTAEPYGPTELEWLPFRCTIPRREVGQAPASGRPLVRFAPNGLSAILTAMGADVDIAAVAALLGERARASMLAALLDGRVHTASQLARAAGVAPSTASGHLSRLLDGGLVVVEIHGRERRYQLSSPAVASAIEVLARIAPATEVRSLRVSQRGDALRAARMCYDHLAGRLGVGVTDALVRRRALRAIGGTFELSRSGESVLSGLGVDVATARARRRAFARPCLDWSERRPHLAGALGAGVADAFIGRGWLSRSSQGRELRITDEGRSALSAALGIDES